MTYEARHAAPDDPILEPAAEPLGVTAEDEYARRAAVVESRIDELVDDDTVIWQPTDKRRNPEGNRYTEYPVPSDDERSFLTTKVTVIDEEGKPRWYVMHVSHGRSTLALYWHKGSDQVLARKKSYNSDGSEPHEATLDELGLAEKMTDPERAQVKRRGPEASTEGLSRKDKVAHYLGRMLGNKNVTRWR